MHFKNILSALLLAVLILTGCRQTEHVPYHSTAEITYFTSATWTNMELIGADDEQADDRDFRILVATDNDELRYVLIAPSDGDEADYTIEDTDILRAVPIKTGSISTLTAELGRTLELWDGDQLDGQGDFVEFMHAPEQDIRRVSENVVEWRPALRYTFSKTPSGPTARMLLGDSPDSGLQKVITFEDREEIADFRQVLQAASDQI